VVEFPTPLPVGHKRTVARRQFVQMPSQRLCQTREKRARAGRLSKAHKADAVRVRQSAAWHAATSLGFAERKSSARGPACSDTTQPTDAPPTQFENGTGREKGLRAVVDHWWVGPGRVLPSGGLAHTLPIMRGSSSAGGPTSRVGLISARPRAIGSVFDGRHTQLATSQRIGSTIPASCRLVPLRPVTLLQW